MAYDDPKVMASLIALIGILITAVLGATGYIYRVRLDEKKSARKVLYLLLEIRYAIRVGLFDSKAVTNEYITFAETHLWPNGQEIIPLDANYRDAINQYLEALLQSLQTDIEKRLLPPYEESLMELASVSPVLAYKLRGKEKVADLMRKTSEYESQLQSLFGPEIPEAMRNVLLNAANETKDESILEACELLDRDVLALAKSCGWRDYRACREIIRNGSPTRNLVDFSTLDATFHQLVERTVAEIRETAPSVNS